MNYCCGVSRHIYMLSTYLLEKNHRVVIAANGGSMHKEIQSAGICFENISFSANNTNIVQILKTYVTVIQLIKKYDIHIVHSHHRWLELIFLLTKPFHHASGVMTCHNLLSGKRRISYRSAKIIAVSDAVCDHLTEYFHIDNSKITTIRNAPREFEKIDKASVVQCKKNLGIAEDRLVIGGFGRLHKEKGFDILIESLKMAFAMGYQCDCIIAGDGPERKMLESMAKESKLMIHFFRRGIEFESLL